MHTNFERFLTNGENDKIRDVFVKNWINECSPGRLLDVGAGKMPYKKLIQSQGLTYVSHDFEKYSGDKINPGLQSTNWLTEGHDLVCDIEDLSAADFDYVLCTEVLEHVPDPVKAIEAISRTMRENAEILITVPFSSRMHQSPYWFSSGLSPFWFEHHLPSFKLKIIKITVAGDFFDVCMQEIPLMLQPLNPKIRLGNLCFKALKRFAPFFRSRLSEDLLESGGQSVFVIAKKVGHNLNQEYKNNPQEQMNEKS